LSLFTAIIINYAG